MNDSEQSPATHVHVSRWTTLCLLALILCAATGYFRAFSTFAEYDDEGYVMLSLKQHLSGGALFDDVYSQYGPGWYAAQSAFHRLTSLPVSHDVTRFKTLTIWLAIASLAGVALWQLLQCRYFALAGAVLSFLHLERVTLEPGHPQELCTFALAATLALTTRAKKHSCWNLLALGAIVGLAVVTKLNVGLLLVASLALAFSTAARNERHRRLLSTTVVVMIVAGVVVLTRSTFSELRGFRLPILVACSSGCVAWIAFENSAKQIRFGEHALIHTTWIIVAAAACLVTLAGGTSTTALLDGLILQHLGFADRFYTAAPIYGFAAPLAFASMVGLVWLQQSESRWQRILPTVIRYARLGAMVAIGGVLLRHFTDLRTPIAHGLDDRGHAGLLMSLLVPAAWVLLLSGRKGKEPVEFGRLVLACVAVLQPLIAYPIPGAQMAAGSIPALLVGLVLASDFVKQEATARSTTAFALRFRRTVVGAALLLLTLSTACQWEHFERFEPLGLHGAKRLRVHPARSKELRELTAALHANGDTFFSLHNGYNLSLIHI